MTGLNQAGRLQRWQEKQDRFAEIPQDSVPSMTPSLAGDSQRTEMQWVPLFGCFDLGKDEH